MNNLYPNLTQLSNIFNLNNYCLMKSFMFLISLYGKNINNGKMSIGVANSSDRNIIARFVYSKYDLVLKEQTSNTCYYKNGIHYEYKTNDDKVFVYVDAIDKIE